MVMETVVAKASVVPVDQVVHVAQAEFRASIGQRALVMKVCMFTFFISVWICHLECFIAGQGEDGENGSLDEAPQMPALYVGLLTRIIGKLECIIIVVAACTMIFQGGTFGNFSGGRGGKGGTGSGGCGKDGESSEFAFHLFSYQEEPQRPGLFTMLIPSAIPANLRQLLRDEGIQSVGGLFEAYDTDMRSQSFESGESSVVSAVLSKFAVRREILV
jgi:hypothetical protein